MKTLLLSLVYPPYPGPWALVLKKLTDELRRQEAAYDLITASPNGILHKEEPVPGATHWLLGPNYHLPPPAEPRYLMRLSFLLNLKIFLETMIKPATYERIIAIGALSTALAVQPTDQTPLYILHDNFDRERPGGLYGLLATKLRARPTALSFYIDNEQTLLPLDHKSLRDFYYKSEKRSTEGGALGVTEIWPLLKKRSPDNHSA